MTKLTYLATPYSDADPAVRQARFEAVNAVAARLFREGVHVWSPISHSHPIAQHGGLPCDWSFWAEYDRAMLSMCRKLLVLRLEGWDRSIGVTAEIQIATELGLEIEFIDH